MNKDSLNFAGSVLGQMLACKKDMFYRFLSNEEINLRQLVYSFSRRLLRRIAMRGDSVNSKDPRCLIAEAKRLLNLGKCQCCDFASQIASISLCMLQCNILGNSKRYESYETIGGVLRDVTQASVELTVTEKIWGILINVLQTIAEAFHFDRDEMMRAIINSNDKELNAVRRAFEALQPAA